MIDKNNIVINGKFERYFNDVGWDIPMKEDEYDKPKSFDETIEDENYIYCLEYVEHFLSIWRVKK
jgi:hypothetical protein